MKVIAVRGDSQYLLVEEGFDPQNPKAQAQVFDEDQNVLFAPFNFHSILARGYWEEFTGDQATILAKAAKAGK